MFALTMRSMETQNQVLHPKGPVYKSNGASPAQYLSTKYPQSNEYLHHRIRIASIPISNLPVMNRVGVVASRIDAISEHCVTEHHFVSIIKASLFCDLFTIDQ